MMKDKPPLKWPRRIICGVGALIYFVSAYLLGDVAAIFWVFGIILLIGVFY